MKKKTFKVKKRAKCLKKIRQPKPSLFEYLQNLEFYNIYE
jgi:hypothetical protein